MGNLLIASFKRLKHEKTFWLGLIIMIALSLVLIYNNYTVEPKIGIGYFFFLFSLYVPIILAIFTGLFIGREYSDGTIRNKIIAGHSRISIYFSNFIIVVFTGFVISAAYMLMLLIVGIPFLGTFQENYQIILKYLLGSVVLLLSFSSIYTLISMGIQNKTVATLISSVGIFIMLFMSSSIFSSLNEPEYYSAYEYTDETGQHFIEEETKNPYYLNGTKRKVYEFLSDFLPTSRGDSNCKLRS